MMKKTLLYISTILLVLGFTGCKDDFDPNGNLEPSLYEESYEESLSINETIFNINYRAQKIYINVEAINVPWYIDNIPNDIFIDCIQSDFSEKVCVSIPANISGDKDRIIVLEIKPVNNYQNIDSQKVFITQTHTYPNLELSQDTFSLKKNAQDIIIQIKSNCSWTPLIDCDWISINSSYNNELSLYIAENTTGESRADYIHINYATYSKQILIFQFGDR